MTRAKRLHSIFRQPIVLAFLLVFLLSGPIKAQDSVIEKVEEQFVTDYKKLMTASIMERSDNLAPSFRVGLAGFLNNEATFDYDFKRLSKFVKRTEDPKGHFRIFGYDELTGGKRHEMVNIAQIKLRDGRVITEFLNNSNELSLGDFNDVIIFDVIPWGKNEDELDLYIFLGWGSNDKKQQFETVRVYQFNGVQLKQLEGISTRGGDPVNEIAIEAPRSADIEIKVNSDNQTIEFFGYMPLPNGGWGKSKNPITLKWEGANFNKN